MLQDRLLCSLGRIEALAGEKRITALTLRNAEVQASSSQSLKGCSWKGNWAVIAQDDLDIFSSRRLACIPVDGTLFQIPRAKAPSRLQAVTLSSEESWKDWTWANGSLTLRVASPPEDLLGFLISNE